MDPQKVIWNNRTIDNYEGIVLPKTIKGVMESWKTARSSTSTNPWALIASMLKCTCFLDKTKCNKYVTERVRRLVS